VRDWLEFHDSTMTAVTSIDDRLQIGLDGYVHRWHWQDGRWVGTGWTQPIRITIEEVRTATPFPPEPIDVHVGSVRTATAHYDGVLPLPFVATAGIELNWQWVDGSSSRVIGAALRCSAAGDATFVEDTDFEPFDMPADETQTVKLATLHGHDTRHHRYDHVFVREATTGPDRLCVAPRPRHTHLMLALAAVLTPPFGLLYVLHTPRARARHGRYQSPWLERERLEELFERFGDFWAGDSRHDVWLYSQSDEATLVWDRHDLIYAYGPLDRFVTVLERDGLRRAVDVSIPSPHVHFYNAEWDHAQDALLRAVDWDISPLLPADEQ
jgi:hypothetical protein